jgi:hypothetical protein
MEHFNVNNDFEVDAANAYIICRIIYYKNKVNATISKKKKRKKNKIYKKNSCFKTNGIICLKKH